MIQWVMPSVDPVWRRECLATLAPHIVERVLVVDNSGGRNRGVAASWNLGIDRAVGMRADWLVLVSESMRFGVAAGTDWEAEVAAASGIYPFVDALWGWHLIAFRTSALQLVGRFDENFHPAYLEDTDYLIRMARAGICSPRENNLPRLLLTTIDASHTGTEHSIRGGLVEPNLAACRDYYRRKWGCDEPDAVHLTPFDRPGVSWDWWPAPSR